MKEPRSYEELGREEPRNPCGGLCSAGARDLPKALDDVVRERRNGLGGKGRGGMGQGGKGAGKGGEGEKERGEKRTRSPPRSDEAAPAGQQQQMSTAASPAVRPVPPRAPRRASVAGLPGRPAVIGSQQQQHIASAPPTIQQQQQQQMHTAAPTAAAPVSCGAPGRASVVGLPGRAADTGPQQQQPQPCSNTVTMFEAWQRLGSLLLPQQQWVVWRNEMNNSQHTVAQRLSNKGPINVPPGDKRSTYMQLAANWWAYEGTDQPLVPSVKQKKDVKGMQNKLRKTAEQQQQPQQQE